MSAPLFDWLRTRSAGVLLHPTSLPSRGGIGCFDQEAFRFLRWLKEAGFSSWQVCPLGHTGYGDSPYAPFSSRAGNPYLVDLWSLTRFGLLTASDLAPLDALPPHAVDYGWLYHARWPVLRQAWLNFDAQGRPRLPGYGDFAEFRRTQASWLDAYSLFMACKDHFGGKPWLEWPAAQRTLAQTKQSALADLLEEKATQYAFFQFLFFAQWKAIRTEAKALGIDIIGDVPIFVALDSADVWAQPEYFQLAADGQPTGVAGVPPDYFSETGQLWGNPLYNWEAMAADGYRWWMERLAANFETCDIVRFDHFRGFESYWRVPADALDARGGKWIAGPGLPFFEAIRKNFPDARLINEDLGIITPEVAELREAVGAPGMAILQFAFDGKHRSAYLPHNLLPNTVVYTGTHDNDTTVGWYATAPEVQRDQVRRYLSIPGHDIAWDMIRCAYATTARLVIIPLQDLLALPGSARFNTPGAAQGNWAWRVTHPQLDRLAQPGNIAYLRSLGQVFQRLPEPTTTVVK